MVRGASAGDDSDPVVAVVDIRQVVERNVMDEHMRDFILDLAGCMQKRNATRREEILTGWEEYFTQKGIRGFEAQLREFTAVVHERQLHGDDSIAV